MKLTIAAFIVISIAALTSPAQAQCPSNLSGEQMIDCITIENAGYFYPAQEATDTNQVSNTDSDGKITSTVSEVTTMSAAN